MAAAVQRSGAPRSLLHLRSARSPHLLAARRAQDPAAIPRPSPLHLDLTARCGTRCSTCTRATRRWTRRGSGTWRRCPPRRRGAHGRAQDARGRSRAVLHSCLQPAPQDWVRWRCTPMRTPTRCRCLRCTRVGSATSLCESPHTWRRHTVVPLQGGRWLESSTVAHEGAGGYGTQRHHVPQTASPEASERWPGVAGGAQHGSILHGARSPPHTPACPPPRHPLLPAAARPRCAPSCTDYMAPAAGEGRAGGAPVPRVQAGRRARARGAQRRAGCAARPRSGAPGVPCLAATAAGLCHIEPSTRPFVSTCPPSLRRRALDGA